jgi:hypothetical protein
MDESLYKRPGWIGHGRNTLTDGGPLPEHDALGDGGGARDGHVTGPAPAPLGAARRVPGLLVEPALVVAVFDYLYIKRSEVLVVCDSSISTFGQHIRVRRVVVFPSQLSISKTTPHTTDRYVVWSPEWMLLFSGTFGYSQRCSRSNETAW